MPTKILHHHAFAGTTTRHFLSFSTVKSSQIKWISNKVTLYVELNSLFLLPCSSKCCAWNISDQGWFSPVLDYFSLFSVLIMWAGFLFPLQNLTTHLQRIYSGWLQVSARGYLVKGVIHNAQQPPFSFSEFAPVVRHLRHTFRNNTNPQQQTALYEISSRLLWVFLSKQMHVFKSINHFGFIHGY